MTEVFVSFKADSPDELMKLMLHFALNGRTSPTWLGKPLDAEALQAEAEARDRIEAEDAAEDAVEHAQGNGPDPDPPPVPPEPKRARTRVPRVSAPAVATPAPAPVPAPPAPPPVDLPPLDTLKSIVTAGVRLAQKGEGPAKILDLLPGFKDATGLAFVMNAEDRHRGALYDLVQAAGLPVV